MANPSMTGKICIITGAASGMGRIAARELAKMGATIIMNDRELDEGREACADIIRISGNDKVRFIGCDMGEFNQVRSFAEHILQHYPAVHVLINNAGLTDPELKFNNDGHEQHMAIMHLGHYLLIQLLLDCMLKSAPARIIQISSEAHKAGSGIDFDDMVCNKIWKGRRYANFGAFQAYHRAKLAMIFATYELADLLKGTDITINAVSPGFFVGTNLFRHMRGIMKLGVKLVRPLLADPERSAQTYIYLATSPEVEGITGKYWEYCKEKDTSPMSHDKLLQEKLIYFSKNALKLNQTPL
ncbi:MAG: SDR family oxidoreductase [Gammaproteobacteria bacterium]|jgi:NAD(P)-dependent dehydrogenase (short-subunit alcohol dehydrogenase family)|nr:SDR family oxidoreductase [Gammaproteobacteria bacterium]